MGRHRADTADTPLGGRFVLHSQLGYGASGVVWSAHDLRRRELVAVKVMRPGTVDPPGAVTEAMVRLAHPHVVAPYFGERVGGQSFVAMPLVRGGTVHQLTTHGPLPPVHVARLLDQLLQGLACVHSSGLVHRDVKPSNLLLDANGTLRLGDFGAAARIGEATDADVGTDGYLAAEGNATPHPTQDLYSAGAVAAHLLTGQPPWRGMVRPNGPLGTVVTMLTAPNPAARPPSARHARALLMRAAAHLHPAATGAEHRLLAS